MAGFILAAGAGTRLRPLTYVRPKALCPVGNRPLVDLAIDRVRVVTDAIAVNVHHHRERLEAHLAGRVHLSVEEPVVLGTAGAIGHARTWIDGRAVLVVNADAWTGADLTAMVAGWDGERVRVGVVGDDRLQPRSPVVASLLPWSVAAALPAEPGGLYDLVWRRAEADQRLDVVRFDVPFVDCGTPRDYLRANLLASGGASVVDDQAQVEGRIERSVVWDTGRVWPGEDLVDAIRIGSRLTVLVR